MISIVDYGLGNIKAFENIYRRLNIQVQVATTTKELRTAERLILPGVGSFDWAMLLLNKSGMRNCLDDLVLDKKIPVLGVCVGMQIMARESEEGSSEGLGWINADVKKLRVDDLGLQLPHMGWNKVNPTNSSPLFNGVDEGKPYYFLHSYYISPVIEEEILSLTEHGVNFASCVGRGNVYGTQFHPEKSHDQGVQLLRNFSRL